MGIVSVDIREKPLTLTEDPPPAPPPVEKDRGKPRLSKEAVELLVVMGFAYLPMALPSIVVAAFPPAAHEPASPLAALNYIPTMAMMAIPLLYIVTLGGRGVESLGLVRVRKRDLAWGLLVCFAGYVGAIIVSYLIAALMPAGDRVHETALPLFGSGRRNWQEILAIIAASLAIGFGEETLFRGYFITQWKRLSGSTGQALLFSTVLFGIWHAYQGVNGMFTTAALGLVYALFRLRLRSLWPMIFAHALTDFIAFSIR